jgi:probable HAF family extracellular repeat protein
MLRRVTMFACVLTVLLLETAATWATTYTITDLGSLGATSGVLNQPYGINNAGTVVGRSSNTAGQLRSFSWTNGTITDLNPLLTYYGGTGVGQAYAVNSSGYVTGMSKTAIANHAYLYNPNNSLSIDLWPNSYDGTGMPPGPDPSAGYSINDSNQIVGQNGALHAFIYSGTISQVDMQLSGLLSSLPGNTGSGSTAYGINNAGIVAGSYTASSGLMPFLYNGVAASQLPLFTGGTAGEAKFINSLNHISGLGTYSDGLKYGYFYNGTTAYKLGTLGGSSGGITSQVRGMNNNDVLVGQTYSGTTGKAVIFNLDGTLMNLSTLPEVTAAGWSTLTAATGVNDQGWIVGWGTHNGLTNSGFLLKPVPEPSTLLLASAGLLGLVAYAWRKRK